MQLRRNGCTVLAAELRVRRTNYLYEAKTARVNRHVHSCSPLLDRVVANVALCRRILGSRDAAMLFIMDTFI
jgi:hypothetical protein